MMRIFRRSLGIFRRSLGSLGGLWREEAPSMNLPLAENADRPLARGTVHELASGGERLPPRSRRPPMNLPMNLLPLAVTGGERC